MRAAAFLFSTVIAGVAFGADVYRSVDDNGAVTFSDRPDQASSERIVVVTARAGGGAAAQQAALRQNGNGTEPETERVVVDGGETPREATPGERAAERARNCEIATERAERYRNSRRLYRELPNGEREYLDDAEIDTAKADAEADVANWCG